MSLRLLWFDLRHGLPTALRVLVRELGLLRALRVVLALVWRDLTTRPFRALRDGPPPGPGERFTRRQLKPILLLDGVLRDRLPAERAREVLAEVVAQSGARFVLFNIEHPSRDTWETLDDEGRRELAGGMLDRFGNAEAELVEVSDGGLGFDVGRCHFVELTQRLGRPELASLFCAADSVAYGDRRLPIALEREHTLARGDPCCTFRFRFREPADG